MDEVSHHDLMTNTTDIVAAYVSNNALQAKDLPGLIQNTYQQMVALRGAPEAPRPDPAVPVAKSVTDAHIICLEDGAKLKMLKRYLRTHYNMSPDEYRVRWGLPVDYPMVAPEYARRRSDFAKKIGLGKK